MSFQGRNNLVFADTRVPDSLLTSAPGTESPVGQRQVGLTLLEVAVALSVFVVLILSVTMTLVRGMNQREETFQLYRGRSALRTLIAEIQETANQPQDLQAETGVGSIYGKYHGQTFSVPDLPYGQILVLVSANENTVPSFLGGPQDLNFDGDALDNLDSAASGPDLKLVPVELTLTFTEDNVYRTIKVHRLLTRTAGE
jgi:hypothetical protein